MMFSERESPFPGVDFQVNHLKLNWLVVSTPLKHVNQNGSFPQIGGESKKYLKPPK